MEMEVGQMLANERDIFMKLKRIDQNHTSGKEEYGRRFWETLLWDDRSGTQEEGVQNVRGIRGVGAETGGET